MNLSGITDYGDLSTQKKAYINFDHIN